MVGRACGAVLTAWVLMHGPVTATADAGWVAPFVALSPSPGAVSDAGAALEARVRWARRLGRYGEAEGATRALLRALEGELPPVLEREVLQALARRAHPMGLEALRARLGQARRPPLELFLALAALGAPAVEGLVGALRGAEAPYAAEALRRLGPAAREALRRVARDAGEAEAVRRAAAEVLAEVDAGAGTGAGRGTGTGTSASARGSTSAGAGGCIARDSRVREVLGLALALRAAGGTAQAWTGLRQALRSIGDDPLALRMLGIANDTEGLGSVLIRGLGAEDSGLRLAAAQAAGWITPDPSVGAGVRRALVVEREPQVFMALAWAAQIQGVTVPHEALGWAMRRSDTAAEAFALAARAGSSPALERRLRRALAAAAGSPRLRAAAALALGGLGGARGRTALVAALEDPSERVRRAALRALAAVGDRELAPELFAHSRAEPSGELAALGYALGRALGAGQTVPLALAGAAPRVIRAGPSVPAAVGERPLEVLLPDGRWLRVAPVCSGVWLLTDIPDGELLVWPTLDDH